MPQGASVRHRRTFDHLLSVIPTNARFFTPFISPPEVLLIWRWMSEEVTARRCRKRITTRCSPYASVSKCCTRNVFGDQVAQRAFDDLDDVVLSVTYSRNTSAFFKMPPILLPYSIIGKQNLGVLTTWMPQEYVSFLSRNETIHSFITVLVMEHTLRKKKGFIALWWGFIFKDQNKK